MEHLPDLARVDLGKPEILRDVHFNAGLRAGARQWTASITRPAMETKRRTGAPPLAKVNN
jgi:hypothetical protein